MGSLKAAFVRGFGAGARSREGPERTGAGGEDGTVLGPRAAASRCSASPPGLVLSPEARRCFRQPRAGLPMVFTQPNPAGCMALGSGEGSGCGARLLV